MARIEAAPELLEDFRSHLRPSCAVRTGAGARADRGHYRGDPAAGVEPADWASRCLRELVIGRGSRGYVALYSYVVELDAVFVLAIRSQREAGYARGEG